jgi:hypothetical protein
MRLLGVLRRGLLAYQAAGRGEESGGKGESGGAKGGKGLHVDIVPDRACPVER